MFVFVFVFFLSNQTGNNVFLVARYRNSFNKDEEKKRSLKHKAQ